MNRLHIRWKLTLWYGGVLAVVLTLFSGSVYFVMRHQLLQRIDQGLHEELSDVMSEVKRATSSSGLLEWLNRRFAQHEGFDFEITKPDGQRFFVNPRLVERELSFSQPLATTTAKIESLSVGSAGRWRVVSINVDGPEGPLTVKVGRSLAAFEQESQELLFTFLLTGPVMLLIVVGGGYVLARRSLQPVQTMTQTAKQITAERLNQRINVDNPNDELGELAQTLNQMIEGLERSFTEMQRFTADAAHELRTPLAVIRNEAEVALRSPRSTEDYCRVLENLLEETIRLSNMADQLLFLSRQDAGLQVLKQESLAMDQLLAEVSANMQMVAQEKGVRLTLESNAPCQLAGDRTQLRRVFFNLLDNAIKYANASGQIVVSSQTNNGELTITITDTGIGIPPEHLPRLFDRFYRVDPARSGDESGAGLGLSICQSIVRSMGGRIQIESTVGKGTTVTISLPRSFG
jgi:two-component system, OmpR family, heavy metal sensor histidine kinase CusS